MIDVLRGVRAHRGGEVARRSRRSCRRGARRARPARRGASPRATTRCSRSTSRPARSPRRRWRAGSSAACAPGALLPVLLRRGDRARSAPPCCCAAWWSCCPPPPTGRAPRHVARRRRRARTLGADAAAPFTALVFKTMLDRYAGHALGVPRRLGHRCTPTRRCSTRRRARASASASSSRMRGGGARGRAGGRARRRRRRGEAEGRAHRPSAHGREEGRAPRASSTIPRGALSYAIHAKAKDEEDKVFTSLARLVEEDPTLHVGRDPSTGEFLLTGMGELHIRDRVAPPAPALRGRGRAQDAEGPLPRDRHGARRERGGEAQEADRRQGHVRGLLPDGRASPRGARARLRRTRSWAARSRAT